MFKLCAKPFRIVDENGVVVDPPAFAALNLTGQDLVELHEEMWLGRLFGEETAVQHKQGKSKLWIPYFGQEGLQHGSAKAANTFSPRPRIFAYARSHGPYISRLPLEYVFDGFYFYGQLPEDIARVYDEAGLYPFYTGVGYHFLHAVGLTLSHKLVDGSLRPAIAYSGDAATAQADWAVAMNLAAIKQAPLIHICENNQFAISQRPWEETATATYAEKAFGFGTKIAVEWFDGNDPYASCAVMRAALNRAALTGKGTYAVGDTYRTGVHTTTLGDRHKQPKEELEEALNYCPIKRNYLLLISDVGKRLGVEWTKEKEEALKNRLRSEIKKAAAVSYAKVEEYKKDLRRFVAVNTALRSAKAIPRQPEHVSFKPEVIENVDARYASTLAVHDAGGAIHVGNDIEFGGVTMNSCLPKEIVEAVCPEYLSKLVDGALPLKTRFPKFVHNFPLAESALGGAGLGMALGGTPVIIEPQFSGFVWPAMHQIQEAARFRQRTSGVVSPSVVYRMLFGGGDGIEYHRESEIAALMTIAGVVVVCGWNPQRMYELMFAALLAGKLVFVCEHLGLFGTKASELQRGWPSTPVEEFGIETVREGTDVTVLSYGRLVHECLAAAEDERVVGAGINAKVVALLTLSPLDERKISEAVATTRGRFLIVQEEPGGRGVGAFVAAAIAGQETSFLQLQAPITSLGSPDEFPLPPFAWTAHTVGRDQIVENIIRIAKF